MNIYRFFFSFWISSWKQLSETLKKLLSGVCVTTSQYMNILTALHRLKNDFPQCHLQHTRTVLCTKFCHHWNFSNTTVNTCSHLHLLTLIFLLWTFFMCLFNAFVVSPVNVCSDYLFKTVRHFLKDKWGKLFLELWSKGDN